MTFETFKHSITENKAVLIYFSNEKCNICKVLKPKIIALFEEKFPEIKTYFVDIDSDSELAGQLRIFAIPTVLIFFEGSEAVRASRNVSLSELENKVERYYTMLFR
ncbi:MAG: thiol reductase thioredoxin [Bacteroidia bacterium]|nr:MAG: thiol reductase thioredoxin [Bacteroidia bacterium]